jgi:hypothetical protein
MVEHVSTSEKKNGNQANCRPNVTVLDDWQKIWPSNTQEGNRSQYSRGDSNAAYPVNRSIDWGVGSVLEVTGNPGVDLLCGLWPVVQLI